MTTASERHATKCLNCQDSGWKIVDVPGKPRRATRCDCFLARRNKHVLKSTGIPPRHLACTLADFDIDFSGADTSLASARLAAGRFVEEYAPHSPGLLFIGKPGTGKTHLSVGIIHELVRSEIARCLFCDYRELLKEIQNTYRPRVEVTEMQILGPVFETDVLVLDDLGAVKPTAWVWDMVSSVINHRYNEKKTTIITTNLPDLPERNKETEIEGFSRSDRDKHSRSDTLGDRITDQMRSRLHEMCRIVILKGDDFRMGPERKAVRATGNPAQTRRAKTS